jgi:hypothetical protein
MAKSISDQLKSWAREAGFESLEGVTLRDVAARKAAHDNLDDARRTSERTSERMAAFVRGMAS